VKPKIYPEQRGNGTAKQVELKRAASEYERQARGAKKGFDAVNKPIDIDDRGKAFKKGESRPHKIQSLRTLSLNVGRGSLIDWFSETKYCCNHHLGPRRYAQSFFRNILDPVIARSVGERGRIIKGVSFGERDKETHFSQIWERVDFILLNYGKAVDPIPDSGKPAFTESAFQPMIDWMKNGAEVGDALKTSTIIQTVDGFDWTLPERTRSGAEQAGITLVHLAAKLGYANKKDLKALAERHSKELNDFGSLRTVRVYASDGLNREHPIDVLVFNPDQAAYLALSSPHSKGLQITARDV